HYLRLLSLSPPPADLSTLSLHDALPILLLQLEGSGAHALLPKIRERHVRRIDGRVARRQHEQQRRLRPLHAEDDGVGLRRLDRRSEEHTSELQSLAYLVCRLLLEKKKLH